MKLHVAVVCFACVLLTAAVPCLSAQTATAAGQNGASQNEVTQEDIRKLQNEIYLLRQSAGKQTAESETLRKSLEEKQEKLEQAQASFEASQRAMQDQAKKDRAAQSALSTAVLNAQQQEQSASRTGRLILMAFLALLIAVLIYIGHSVRTRRVLEVRSVAAAGREKALYNPQRDHPDQIRDPFSLLPSGLPIAYIEPASESAVIQHAVAKRLKRFILFLHLKEENLYIPCIAEVDLDKVLIHAHQNDKGTKWKYRMDKAVLSLQKSTGVKLIDQADPVLN